LDALGEVPLRGRPVFQQLAEFLPWVIGVRFGGASVDCREVPESLNAVPGIILMAGYKTEHIHKRVNDLLGIFWDLPLDQLFIYRGLWVGGHFISYS
jgi:hypothetical protein